ncbi:MAG: hypothetical protein KGV44_10365 [Flavobacteriaceae bacterium]|nr:hypothetical protein [Flavobacteriaceae bacterium]
MKKIYSLFKISSFLFFSTLLFQCSINEDIAHFEKKENTIKVKLTAEEQRKFDLFINDYEYYMLVPVTQRVKYYMKKAGLSYGEIQRFSLNYKGFGDLEAIKAKIEKANLNKGDIVSDFLFYSKVSGKLVNFYGIKCNETSLRRAIFKNLDKNGTNFLKYAYKRMLKKDNNKMSRMAYRNANNGNYSGNIKYCDFGTFKVNGKEVGRISQSATPIKDRRYTRFFLDSIGFTRVSADSRRGYKKSSVRRRGSVEPPINRDEKPGLCPIIIYTCDKYDEEADAYDLGDLGEVVITAKLKKDSNLPETFYPPWFWKNRYDNQDDNIDTYPYHDPNKKDNLFPPSLGWQGGAIAKLLAPNHPIENLEDFLVCIDTSSPAVFTLYVREPEAGSGKPYKGLNNVGHSFISIEQSGITRTYGFYPKENVVKPAIDNNSEGIMGDNGGDIYTVSLSKEITSSQLKDLVQFSINSASKNYNLNNNNCTNFAFLAAKKVDISIPFEKIQDSWPLGGGANPGTLGLYIRKTDYKGCIKKSYNRDFPKSPSSTGSC